MNEVANPLGFSEQWFALGLITKPQHQELLVEFQKGDDPHPEHYRWRVFCNFLGRHDPLSDQLMWQLYRLGEMDADHAMGGSMIAAILRRADCPADLVREAARNSDRKHLKKIARDRT
jgi:hypothetical protein